MTFSPATGAWAGSGASALSVFGVGGLSFLLILALAVARLAHHDRQHYGQYRQEDPLREDGHGTVSPGLGEPTDSVRR